MIVMFVSNKDGIDPIGIFANEFQPLRCFPPAHAGIDQQPHLFRPDESRVSAAPASEHRHCHSHSLNYV
jgi:hypothetical protein